MALPNRNRLRKAIGRVAAAGWTRAVFGKPGGNEAETEVLERDALGDDALIDRVEEAAGRGLLKLTFVMEDGSRIRIDARYGKAKVIPLDPERARKATGGKSRALDPVQSAPFLRVIGLMNADGTLSTRHAKKYKQVNHFVELCRPAWERLQAHRKITATDPLRILDLGCGNSYLTFVLAEALRLESLPSTIHGIDIREDVIERSRARAEELGWSHLSFSVGRIADAVAVSEPDIVIALHACDTATDESLALAIGRAASVILAAPCCQRELAAQLGERRTTESPKSALLQHGLLRRDYASTLTDALRIDVLDACGYKVDAVEFVASEHTPKNLLIRAHRRPRASVDREKLQVIRKRCETLGVTPALLGLVEERPL